MHDNQESKELEIGDELEIGADKYKVVGFLPGRGPGKGLGVFAEKLDDTKAQVIIKEDEHPICVAEGLMTLPTSDKDDFSTSAIQASLGILNKTGTSTPILVTVQPKFVAEEDQEVMGFDEFIFGRKRDPKTVWSEESWHKKEIADCISAMTEPVKKQLAKAIYLSQLNGDESVHTGQFMVTVREDPMGKKEITGIVKVDFGALGRWAGERSIQSDFNLFETSQTYRNTWSQMSNDYVSYLLNDDTVKKELVRLWTKLDAQQFIKDVESKFEQLCQLLKVFDNKSSVNNTDKILRDFYNDVLFKGGRRPLVDDEALIDKVNGKLLSTTLLRCQHMYKQAQSIRIKEVIGEILPKLPSTPVYEGMKAMSNLLGNGVEPSTGECNDIISELADLSTLEQLEAYIKRIEQFNRAAPDPSYVRLLEMLYPLKEEINPTKADSVRKFRRLLTTQQDEGDEQSKTPTPPGRTSP